MMKDFFDTMRVNSINKIYFKIFQYHFVLDFWASFAPYFKLAH